MIRPIATATPPNACEGSRPIYTELGAKLARDAGFHVVACPHCAIAPADPDGFACDYCRGYAHRPKMTPAELAALARCTPINTKGSKA